MGVFRRFKDPNGHGLGNSLAVLPLSPRDNMTVSVSKNATIADNAVSNSVNIQKIKGSFYNYVSHTQSTMSNGTKDEPLKQRYSVTGSVVEGNRLNVGGSKMKFIKNSVLPMLPAMTTEEDL